MIITAVVAVCNLLSYLAYTASYLQLPVVSVAVLGCWLGGRGASCLQYHERLLTVCKAKSAALSSGYRCSIMGVVLASIW